MGWLRSLLSPLRRLWCHMNAVQRKSTSQNHPLLDLALLFPLILLLPHLWNLGIYGVLAAEPVTNIIGGLACYLTMQYVVGRELRG